MMLSNILVVIPGRAEGASPESRRTSVWIPGPPLRGVPE
jgi:hypothetical protein